MSRSLAFVPLLSLVAACGQPVAGNAGAATTENATATAAPASSGAVSPMPGAAAFAPKGDLTDGQRANAIAMHDLIISRAVVVRVAEKCPTIAINEAKMLAERERLRSAAQTVFASKDAALRAAGQGENEVLGEEIHAFFEKRGASWGSSSDQYCAAGKAMIAEGTGPGQYLIAR